MSRREGQGGRVVSLAEARAQRAGAAPVEGVHMRAWIDGPELIVEFPQDVESVRLSVDQVRIWRDNFAALARKLEGGPL